MNKKNYIIIILVALVSLLIVSVISFTLLSKEENPNNEINESALTFKTEYEEYNGLPKSNEFPNLVFNELDIPESNPFVYADYNDIVALIEEGKTGIVYLGFPTCQWCRSVVPVLTNAAIDYGIKQIFYRNILEDRNILSLDENGNLITEKAGDLGYLHLLELLGERAPLYTGIDNEEYRRIYVPVVIFIKDGNVIGYVQTLESYSERLNQEESTEWLPMNETEIEELTDIYLDYFDRLFN